MSTLVSPQHITPETEKMSSSRVFFLQLLTRKSMHLLLLIVVSPPSVLFLVDSPSSLDFHRSSESKSLLTLRQTKSMIRRLPSALGFRGKNLKPDRGTVVNWIAAKRYSSFIGFSVHDNSLMKFRCRMCYKEYPYSGGITTVKRHMASKTHLCRMNAHRVYMGLDLVDANNAEHSYTSRVSVRGLLPMLSGVPALAMEPFVVLDGLPTYLFPPSEVVFVITFLTCF